MLAFLRLSKTPKRTVFKVCESRQRFIILFCLSQGRSHLTWALLRVLFLNTVLRGLLGGSLYLEKMPTSHTDHSELGSSKKAVAGGTSSQSRMPMPALLSPTLPILPQPLQVALTASHLCFSLVHAAPKHKSPLWTRASVRVIQPAVEFIYRILSL